MQNLILVSGSGSVYDGTACLMSAARIFSGEAKLSDPRDDKCSLICPSVRKIAISLNDLPSWSSDAERTAELMPLVPMLINTASSDPFVLRKRAYLCADYAVRVFAPLALDQAKFFHESSRLRSLDPIVDEASAKVGQVTAYVIADRVLSYAAGAAHDAAGAAYWAYAHASAHASASSAAVNVAIAASRVNSPRRKAMLIELLTKLCSIN